MSTVAAGRPATARDLLRQARQQLAGRPNSVSLVTGDAGMRLRAAQRHVKAVAMPAKYLRKPDGSGE